MHVVVFGLKNKMKKILKKILYLLSKSDKLSILSKKIVDYHRNENNCEIETNGEGDFIKKNSKHFDVVFDVGANIGEWSNLIGETLPNSKIYSFEPSKSTFTTLSQNIKSKNISAFNIGLGDKKEEKTFYIYGGDSTLNSSINRDIESHTKTIESAKFDTLENFCSEHKIPKISFLKIDVEGGELSVLKGAEKYIKEGKIDFIQFEYGGTYIDAGILLKDMFNFFDNTPYTIHKVLQHSLKEIKQYSQELENFQYANYIAVLNK